MKNEDRTEMLGVKLTKEEKDALERAANQTGRTKSGYVRFVLNVATQPEQDSQEKAQDR